MRRIVTCLFFLMLLSSLTFAQQKLPEGAMSGDFQLSLTCRLYRVNCPQPKIVVPVEIYATSTLVNRYGEMELENIMRDSLSAFYIQNGVDFTAEVKNGKWITPILQDGEEFTSQVAKSIPRKKNTLVILLSHKRFQDNPELAARGLTYGGINGASWFAVWIDPFRYKIDPRRQIVHELGHEFGLWDSNDGASVMCTAKNTVTGERQTCSTSSVYFSGSELTKISSVINVMKKISFDTYTRLMLGNDSYEVYDVNVVLKDSATGNELKK